MVPDITQEDLDKLEKWLKEHPDVKEADPDIVDDSRTAEADDAAMAVIYRRVLRDHGRLK